MKSIPNNNDKKEVQSHIDTAYKIIEEYLPATYLEKVRAKLPADYKVKDSLIRNVKLKKQKAAAHLKILNALVEIALENKDEGSKLKLLIT